MSSPSPPSSRFAPYRDALNAISKRTRTPLPSLVFSFAILHELTAIVPVVGFFYTARILGVGERVVQTISAPLSSDTPSPTQTWIHEKCREWVDEGGKFAERVGTRYGVFGFEKMSRKEREKAREARAADTNRSLIENGLPERLAGDAANAIVAYALTKALLPVRVGFSLYMSPAFSRGIVEPFRQFVIRPFRRKM